MLAQLGIKLLSEEIMMKDKPGNMKAHYRRPNLRKAKVLKTYHRV